MCSVDGPDDAERLDELAQQSVNDGFSFEPPKPLLSSSKQRIDAPAVLKQGGPVKPTDEAAVAGLVEGTIGKLKPGESAKIGAKVDGAVELVVEAEVGAEIKRRDDGKFEVKLEQSLMVGVGGKVTVGDGKLEAEVKTVGGLKGATSVAFVVDSAEEAAAIVATASAAAAIGAVAPGAPPGSATTIGGLVASARYADKLSEVSVSAGFSFEMAAKLNVVAELEASVSGEMMGGFVYAPPEAFLEVSVKGEVGAEFGLERGDTSIGGPGGTIDGKVTVRIPLGRVGSAEELADPAKQKALLDAAATKQPPITMSFEGTDSVGALLGGVAVERQKEIVGNRLDELFADGGWTTRVKAVLGDKLSGGIGPVTGEVGISYDRTLYTSTSTSPAAAQAEIEAHAAEINKKAKAAQR